MTLAANESVNEPKTEPAEATAKLLTLNHYVPDVVDPLLATILTWPRPHQSLADLRFRDWLDAQIKARCDQSAAVLAEGCRYVVIKGESGKQPTTLFSCHIDTMDMAGDGTLVAGMENNQLMVTQRKALVYDQDFGHVFLSKDSTVGGCLGADDGVGVWIMLHMIKAGVPGGYIFHTGEERGCIGSNAVLRSNKDVLKLYEVAVAFDRPRDNEVITHQGGLECCSDKFAKALSAALNAHNFDFAPSNRGVLTDTKVYRKVIAECTNIGVGYINQHGKTETLDYAHAFALMNAVIEVKWDALPVDRDPEKADPVYSYGGSHGWSGHYPKGGGFNWPEDDNDTWPRRTVPQEQTLKPKKKGKKSRGLPPVYEPVKSVFDDMLIITRDDLQAWVETCPDEAVTTMVALMLEVGRLRSDCAVLSALGGIDETLPN